MTIRVHQGETSPLNSTKRQHDGGQPTKDAGHADRAAALDLNLEQHILESMVKQILIELDADTAARLERAAPARSRRRSEFIRDAIRRALWEIEERETRAAYLLDPDTKEVTWPEPSWETWTTAETTPRSKKR